MRTKKNVVISEYIQEIAYKIDIGNKIKKPCISLQDFFGNT